MSKLVIKSIVLSIIITLLCISSAQAASLTTLFAADNGGSDGGGIYFDLENVGAVPINITSWDVNTETIPANNIEVWFRTGTSQGFEDAATGWQLLGIDPGVVGQGFDVPTPVNVGGLVIAPGEIFGIAMAGGMGWDYTNGTGGNQIYNDGSLEIRTGSANNIAFTPGEFFSPRVWNGTIYYNLAVGVPTMNEWGMIIFMVLAGIGSIYYMRRKRAES